MDDETSCIVGLYCNYKESNREEYLGMGFLADEEHIITCNHLFDRLDFQQVADEIIVKFLFDSKKSVKKAKMQETKKCATDIISLRLLEDRPPDISPARLRSDIFSSFSGDEIELHSWDTLEGLIIINGSVIQSHQDELRISPNDRSKKFIKEGISGSLVYDQKKLGFIGMVYNQGTASEPRAISGLKIIEFCRSNEIHLMIKHTDWNDQATYIKNNLLIDCKGEYLNESLRNIKGMREILSDAGFINPDDDKILNQLSMFVMDQWEKTRIMNFKSPCYLNYNYSACDDTHSILVEEKIYQLLLDDLGSNIPLKSLVNRYLNKREKDIVINSLKDLKSKFILNPDEIFMLVASAWLHDSGMILGPKGNASDFYFHVGKHHELSVRFIEKNRKELGLHEYNHIDKLKEICRSHRHKDYNSLNDLYINSKGSKIKAGLLTAYLRLADSLQLPRNIAIKINMILDFKEPYSRFQWLKSKFVKEIITDRVQHKVIIKIKFINISSNELYHLNALKSILERELQNELDVLSRIFIENNVNFYITACCEIDTDAASDVDMNEFVDLLSSIELFEPIISPTASTVLDIVLNQIKKYLKYNGETKAWLDENEDKEFVLNDIKEYNDLVLSDIIKTRPCHIPIKRIYLFLEDNLSALNDNERLSKLDKSSRNKIYSEICHMIDELCDKRSEIREVLPKMAFDIIKDGSPILLYGYSTHLVNTFRYVFKEFYKNDVSANYELIQKIKNMPIYICEAATKNEYSYNNKIIYNDALKYIEELKHMEVGENSDDFLKNLFFIPDLCAANLFSKIKVSKVIFGANGIELDGHVHHTLGHLAIAEMAKFHEVPVYIIADSLKIGYVEANLEQQRGNLWLTTDIKKERFLHQNKIGTYNPRGDRVPPELITAIVTEKGITRPQDILKHITFDIMIHRSVVPKFKAYNVEDFIEKLKNPFVDDVHSMTEIYKIKSKYILYRKLIKMGIAGKSNLLRSDINLKIDYFLDIMSNKLYIVNIADSIHRSISSEKYFVKMLKLFKGIDEFERFDYLI